MKTMTFGSAVEYLKRGHKVTRPGWNGRGMFLFLVPGGDIEHPALGDEVREAAPYIAMFTATGNVVPWLASQADILAEDWEVAEGR